MSRSIGAAILGMALMVGCAEQPSPAGGGPEDPDGGVPPDAETDTGGNLGDPDEGPGCQPTGERCNGLDDDCDDAVDEDYNIGQPCTVDQNGCTSDGTWTCAEDGAGATCDAPPPMAEPETCDEADNDCDGAVDEDFDLSRDIAHCGACGVACEFANAEALCTAAACGLVACLDGFGNPDGDPANGCECAIANGGDEVCDGLDDDCDGQIDEGLGLGEACSVGVGACAADGVTVCGDGGAVVCGAEPGPPQPEACNGIDDDCNGEVDEGFDADGDGAPACGIDCDAPCPPGLDCADLCARQDCAPDDPGVFPGAREICEDGIDQNCDGRDIACDVPAGRITRLALAAQGGAGCRDINGDGRADNAFGNAVFVGLVNPEMQSAVDDEDLNLLPIAPGLEPPGTDAVFDFAVLFGSPEGNAYRISPDALDAEGLPVMLFPGTRAVDGALDAGPGTFLLTLNQDGQQADLRIQETMVTGTIGAEPTGIRITGGWVTGYVTQEDFDAALVIVPEDFRALVPLFIRADIDTDGDGRADAYSACVEFDAAPAIILGYPPQ